MDSEIVFRKYTQFYGRLVPEFLENIAVIVED